MQASAKQYVHNIHPHAAAAIRAAENRRSWGRYMIQGFLRKRGTPFSLYRLACQLEAASAL